MNHAGDRNIFYLREMRKRFPRALQQDIFYPHILVYVLHNNPYMVYVQYELTSTVGIL